MCGNRVETFIDHQILWSKRYYVCFPTKPIMFSGIKAKLKMDSFIWYTALQSVTIFKTKDKKKSTSANWPGWTHPTLGTSDQCIEQSVGPGYWCL